MFFACLFLAFAIILLLLFKHNRSKHKKLITITIIMIMAGMICWGYHDIAFTVGYPSYVHHNTVVDALINQPIAWTLGMVLLVLSIPSTLFCLLSKPQKIEEIDKLLEDQDDLD